MIPLDGESHATNSVCFPETTYLTMVTDRPLTKHYPKRKSKSIMDQYYLRIYATATYSSDWKYIKAGKSNYCMPHNMEEIRFRDRDISMLRGYRHQHEALTVIRPSKKPKSPVNNFCFNSMQSVRKQETN